MTPQPPLRLGFFSYLQGTKPIADIYRDAIELFVAADELGFDVGWVAQHHFGHHGGLPSPLVFLTSVAERTRHIGLGTAIVSLTMEHPIRLAEDAAVLETLHPGRLHLGVGTGLASDAVLATFTDATGDRRAIYDRAITHVLSTLAGQPVNTDGDTLSPAVPNLRQRIGESPGSPERVAEAARRGSGLLLSRIAIGGGNRSTAEVQVPLVNRYLAELPPGVTPKLGLSRTVYPSRRPEIAHRDLTVGLETMLATQAARGLPPNGLSATERFRHHNIHYGSPDQVIASLRDEPLIDLVTDLICQVQPGLPSLDQTLDALDLIATKVAPALGWRRSGRPAEAAVA